MGEILRFLFPIFASVAMVCFGGTLSVMAWGWWSIPGVIMCAGGFWMLVNYLRALAAGFR